MLPRGKYLPDRLLAHHPPAPRAVRVLPVGLAVLDRNDDDPLRHVALAGVAGLLVQRPGFPRRFPIVGAAVPEHLLGLHAGQDQPNVPPAIETLVQALADSGFRGQSDPRGWSPPSSPPTAHAGGSA